MSLVPIRQLRGVGRIPSCRRNAGNWLARRDVPIMTVPSKGGPCAVVDPANLPAPEHRAWLEREAAAMGLPAGTYDEAAHEAFLDAPASMRETAERRAAMVRLALSAGKDATWVARLALIEERFGRVTKPTLKAYLKAVEGVDPVNFAPALLPDYKGRTATAELSPEAWRFFMDTLRRAGEGFPLKSAWRDVRDVARTRGWAWPPFVTVWRRWQALDESVKAATRIGAAEARKQLALPALRDKTTVGSLEWVSLDGRTLDFWADDGEGAFRPVMLTLVDVRSNYVLGWRLCRSENATDTVGLIKDVCRVFGIFDRLYTDNGSAFAGHLVAGAAEHRFRNGGRRAEGPRPFGALDHLGIELTFALPGNARAKIAERVFATLSRCVDDRPEFAGAHAGHAPGAAPGADVRSVALETVKAIFAREIGRYNREPGRRGQGAGWRSYEAVFDAGLEGRIRRPASARQLWLAGLQFVPRAVDRFGRVHVNGWTYGEAETQDALVRWHGGGKRILFGYDPEDFAAPALAFDPDIRLICEGIEPVERTPYGSEAGVRAAARNRKFIRDAVAKAEEAHERLSDAEFRALTHEISAPPSILPSASEPVVAPRFGGPLQVRRPNDTEASAPVSAEMYRNMDAYLAALKASGGKLA